MLQKIVAGIVAGAVAGALSLLWFADQHYVTRREYEQRNAADVEWRQDTRAQLVRIEQKVDALRREAR